MQAEIQKLSQAIGEVIVGKEETILQAITALLCGGHVLLEDVPGVGKTKLASSLASAIGGSFHRIQLTPDVMPSDITGFSVVDQNTGELSYREGVAMCHFLLADEINRASPKVQSALLEIMEERQISLDGQTHALPQPFMVIATQNPVETYGTFHLPEAQMDRFFMRLRLGYPTQAEELRILEKHGNPSPSSQHLQTVLSTEEICVLRERAQAVEVANSVKAYILALVQATRESEYSLLGVSPRGSISLLRAIKGYAFAHGRKFATPDDVQLLALPVLAHRILLSPKGRNMMESSEGLLRFLLEQIPVPSR